ncbi:MAG: hypothetical protein NTV49_13985, partial [Kiritimatiellaeota bacterium]|nr:hypothetical protein [Kiritimatiellota bacterium]
GGFRLIDHARFAHGAASRRRDAHAGDKAHVVTDGLQDGRQTFGGMRYYCQPSKFRAVHALNAGKRMMLASAGGRMLK